MSHEEFSIRVRAKLREVGMTQTDLANHLGITQPYLSDILLGRRTGKKAQEHLKAVQEILGIKRGD
ncbi:helix-turn-helix domain-containing protein [Amphibacillus sp. Q70]|uniref:helix-turn-helix domain-containing protein n=1 Tax=Amphibacillus sp. Q70 TaxID=3453416 RepID=UPI003F840866